jgi:leucyl/phenylalanyl-tRNA--protein transferase
MRSILRRTAMEVKYDQDVEAIIQYCSKGREGWLTPEAVDLYLGMHERGLIATVGTYRDGMLIGGFWGVSIGPVFAVMSMFHLEKNAGAVAVAKFTETVAQRGCRWSIIDLGHPGTFWDKFGTRAVTARDFSSLVTNELLKSAQSREPQGFRNLELERDAGAL